MDNANTRCYCQSSRCCYVDIVRLFSQQLYSEIRRVPGIREVKDEDMVLYSQWEKTDEYMDNIPSVGSFIIMVWIKCHHLKWLYGWCHQGIGPWAEAWKLNEGFPRGRERQKSEHFQQTEQQAKAQSSKRPPCIQIGADLLATLESGCEQGGKGQMANSGSRAVVLKEWRHYSASEWLSFQSAPSPLHLQTPGVPWLGPRKGSGGFGKRTGLKLLACLQSE